MIPMDGNSSAVSLLVARVALLALLGAGGAAQAYIPPSVNYSPTGGTVTPGNLMGSPSWRAWGTLGGNITARDTLRVGVGASVADMQWNRLITPSSAMRIGVRAIPLIGSAAILYAVLQSANCIYTGGTATGGGFTCEGSTAAQSSPVVRYCLSTTINCQPADAIYWSPQAACASMVSSLPPYWVGDVNYGKCYGSSNGSTYNVIRDIGAGTVTVPNCNGTAPDASGNCPSGQQVTATAEQVAQAIEDRAPQPLLTLRDAVVQAAEMIDLAPDAQPAVQPLTGPSSVPGAVRTTTTTDAQGNTTTRTQQTVTNITYNNNTYNTTTTTVTTNPDGSTTTEEAPPDIQTCGLPGTPPCRIDENGTPTTASDQAARDAVAQAVGQYGTDLSTDIASISEPTFGFIGAPPVVACSPLEFPGDMGSIDPCPVVNPVRDVMAYVWALAAAWIALGWVRQAANGG